LHLRPSFLGLFLARDPVFAPFQGSSKRFKLAIGNGSFTDNVEEINKLAGESPEPAVGEAEDIGALLKGKRFELRSDSEEDVFQKDLAPAVARLSTEYRIEFWSKISLTNPDRTVTGAWLTDGCRHIARVYEGLYTPETENGRKDRFMAIYYCPGADYQYRFYSYYENTGERDLNGYSLNCQFSEIEGVWNYIYLGYDSKIKTSFAGVYFSSTDRLATLKISSTRPRGHPNKIGVVFGAAFGQRTVNGLIDRVSFRYDDDAYLSSTKEILENLDGENGVPPPALPL
jgi:hypothetical protein